LVGLIVSQGWLVVGFVWRLFYFRCELLADDECRRAAVILCLRGGDPFLADCIAGLLELDYPNYDVHIVVDHQGDPAVEILEPLLASNPSENVHVQFLQQPRDTCSLKCSSVVQAVRSLDESVHFVAQLDADTIPHRSWLRELATALADERVGAATGNRWYMPNNRSYAALVRYVWNAAAVVQMYWYRIAWGGSLAVKTSVFRETDLLEKWSNAFCEDTMLFAQLKKAGLELGFAPSLMMVNREDCTMAGYFRWVRRQLLTTRLYHPAWVAVVGHGVFTTLFPLAAIALGVIGLIANQMDVALWCFAGLAFYQVSATVLIPPMEFVARRIVAARGEPTRWMTFGGACKCVVAVALTQVVYFGALCSTCLLRVVDWRGVQYTIRPGKQIKMVEYKPFHSDPPDDGRAVSL
jgi:cellulose synthase/poly-beta-1,6-N-acetylglucosamine synthase-like glycosyltransferase